MSARSPRLGLVTECLVETPLAEVMEWLQRDVPDVEVLEIGTGAYAPPGHCDLALLLADPAARRRWHAEIADHGFSVGALNVWGNPLHPDRSVAEAHDRALRETIRLAGDLGIRRIVALAGCPGAARADTAPAFGAGGWLPYLEGVHERQWRDGAADYWADIAEAAERSDPDLRICLELHPGTLVYNVATFEDLAALGPSLSANIDPSHFFWMGMDARRVVRRLAGRIGHAHAKDVVFEEEALALNGLLDHRWPSNPAALPWTFATVGRGRDGRWWRDSSPTSRPPAPSRRSRSSTRIPSCRRARESWRRPASSRAPSRRPPLPERHHDKGSRRCDRTARLDPPA